jgi:hypothetical protein
MSNDQHNLLRHVVSRLRPSPERLAGASAIYDPELMIQLKATRRQLAVSSRIAPAERPRRSAAQASRGGS